MRFQPRRREEVQLDVTPLVDVVFLLLIFFMLSTTLSINPGIKVDLPKSSAEQVKSKKSSIRVALEANGSMYADGKKVSLARLDAIFNGLAKKDAETLVIIEADKKVYHGIVVTVMDAAKNAGLNKLAIATEPKEK
ncbi:MAG: biopolymer transporter ExbD [Deltaproteobacteria bacterium]|nr:biopolymer transporter ExbD [Candidatus Anaeroferrophillus wilburensis]MBN2889879.1 biopolymer transporter ExbD [Deltaproteobacteria bacterium]